MFVTITTASGTRRRIPLHVDPTRVVGLDAEGRLVVDNFDALTTPNRGTGPFLFGLSLCCNAYDKGGEDGVYCRNCYGEEAGSYLFAFGDRASADPLSEPPARRFPGFDPAVEYRVTNGLFDVAKLPVPVVGGVAVRSHEKSTALLGDDLVALHAAFAAAYVPENLPAGARA